MVLGVTRMPDSPETHSVTCDETTHPTTDTNQGGIGDESATATAAIGNTQPALDLRETIAQAIWRANDNATQSRWGFVDNKARGQYRHQADTVIAALGGLTREVSQASRICSLPGGPCVGMHHARWVSGWLPARPCNPGDTTHE